MLGNGVPDGDMPDSQLPPLWGPAYDERIFNEFAHEARGVCLFRLGRYAEAADARNR